MLVHETQTNPIGSRGGGCSMRSLRLQAGEPAVKEPTEYLNGDVAKTEAVLRADTEIKHQIVKNFGVSGAWWSTGIGDRATMDEILALLFTDQGHRAERLPP